MRSPACSPDGVGLQFSRRRKAKSSSGSGLFANTATAVTAPIWRSRGAREKANEARPALKLEDLQPPDRLPSAINPCPIQEAVIELRYERPKGLIWDAVPGIVFSRLQDKGWDTLERLPIAEVPQEIRRTGLAGRPKSRQGKAAKRGLASAINQPDRAGYLRALASVSPLNAVSAQPPRRLANGSNAGGSSRRVGRGAGMESHDEKALSVHDASACRLFRGLQSDP